MSSLPSHADLTPFFHAVIQHLAMSPGGVTFIAKLGLDPSIKLAWSALNLSKSKKMANLIDTRPDLFSRFMTDRAQPMVKLEPKGYECIPPNEIPPLALDHPMAAAAARLGAAAAAASSSSSAGPMPIGPASIGPLNLNQSEARKLFLRNALDAVAAKDGCVIDLPQLGSVPEVQQAWKMSGLDKRLKMSDVLKERPDLVMVSVSENGSAIVALTQLAIQCVQTGEVPDPDGTCPPPVQGTKKKSGSAARPGPIRGGYGGHRAEPYPAMPGPAFGPAAAGLVGLPPGPYWAGYQPWAQ